MGNVLRFLLISLYTTLSLQAAPGDDDEPATAATSATSARHSSIPAVEHGEPFTTFSQDTLASLLRHSLPAVEITYGQPQATAGDIKETVSPEVALAFINRFLVLTGDDLNPIWPLFPLIQANPQPLEERDFYQWLQQKEFPIEKPAATQLFAVFRAINEQLYETPMYSLFPGRHLGPYHLPSDLYFPGWWGRFLERTGLEEIRNAQVGHFKMIVSKQERYTITLRQGQYFQLQIVSITQSMQQLYLALWCSCAADENDLGLKTRALQLSNQALFTRFKTQIKNMNAMAKLLGFTNLGQRLDMYLTKIAQAIAELDTPQTQETQKMDEGLFVDLQDLDVIITQDTERTKRFLSALSKTDDPFLADILIISTQKQSPSYSMLSAAHQLLMLHDTIERLKALQAQDAQVHQRQIEALQASLKTTQDTLRKAQDELSRTHEADLLASEATETTQRKAQQKAQQKARQKAQKQEKELDALKQKLAGASAKVETLQKEQLAKQKAWEQERAALNAAKAKLERDLATQRQTRASEIQTAEALRRENAALRATVARLQADRDEKVRQEQMRAQLQATIAVQTEIPDSTSQTSDSSTGLVGQLHTLRELVQAKQETIDTLKERLEDKTLAHNNLYRRVTGATADRDTWKGRAEVAETSNQQLVSRLQAAELALQQWQQAQWAATQPAAYPPQPYNSRHYARR